MIAWLIAASLVEPPLVCVDAKGVAVVWLEDEFIKDLAQAQFVTATKDMGPGGVKRPAIQYNPNRTKRLHEKTRAFFFAHECGHHALGHLYGGIQGQDKEQSADCYAIHRMQSDGQLGEGDLETVQHDLAEIGRMDKNHAAGNRRGSNLMWCLKDPPPKPIVQPDAALPPASAPIEEPPQRKKKK